MLKMLMKLFVSKEKLLELMTYKVNSTDEISKVVDKVEDACEKFKFSILHHYIYHELLESKGFPIKRKVYVYEICQAKIASMLLTDDPSFAPFMPCRISVYEEAGSVTISTQNMEIMLNTLKSNTELYTQANELYGTLKSLMNSI